MRLLTAVVVLATALVAWAPAISAEGRVETIGVWQVDQIKDPMTDVVNVAASVASGDTVFALVCKPSEPKTRQIMVVHQPYLGRGTGRFAYRVDDRKAVDISIKLFNRSGFVYGSDAQALFDQLPGAKRVRIQVVDQIIGVTDGEFDVTGVDKVLARMAVLCDGPAKPQRQGSRRARCVF